MQSLTMEHRLVTQDSDAFGLWRVDAAFRLMQELAGAHATALGFSREALMQERGAVWMLARVHFAITAYPRIYDTLQATTWYGPPGRSTYPRYIHIANQNGEGIADFATSWIVVDVESRRILPPQKAGLHFPPALMREPRFPEPKKNRLLCEGEPAVFCRSPLYSDLDVNAHMNNASYMTWLLDVFPMAWHEQHRLSEIHIAYLQEAKPGEQVEMLLYQTGLRFEVLGKDKKDGHAVFEAAGEFERLV